MLVLIVVGFAAGVITSLSPCVLPVLPVVLASNADRPSLAKPGTDAAPGAQHRWRPYGVVAGLVLSFSSSILFGSAVLSALHLPQDLLRDAGIVVLVIIGLSLLVPRLADLLERPFARLPNRNVNPDSNGIVLGLGLGLLFVPCAGPVLATIAVVGATHHIGFGAVILTIAFGIGVGVPLLAVALAGDAIARRTGILRRRARGIRIASGLVMILAAAAIGLNLTDGLQTHVPGYTNALQTSIENKAGAGSALKKLTTTGTTSGPGRVAAGATDAPCTEGGTTLENCGQAPQLTGITGWLNTPGGAALTPQSLSGKVVLIDFWTYSCINCQRTLPHIESWYRSYAQDGFVVVGVHTPEFAFEHVTANIRDQAAALGVKYPIAIDNDYATWTAYSNQYWPAEYLLDPNGEVRHVTFGEGEYGTTESLIRQLLTANHPGVSLPHATDTPDTTPTESQTPETYLGYTYAPLHTSTNSQPPKDKAVTYRFPAKLSDDTFALAGTWTDHAEELTAGPNAKLELSYQADHVYLVLGGTGTVTVTANDSTASITVAGVPKLYSLATDTTGARGLLTLTVGPGVQAYDFTFG